MTENATGAEAPADQPLDPAAPDHTDDTSDTVSGDDSGQDDDHTDESPNAEAARYRVRLRAVEAERDGLAERLTKYQRAELESAVADLLEIPADLFDVGGVQVSDFYDDTGNVKADELRAAAGALIDERPRFAKPHTQRTWGQHSAEPPRQAGPSWADIINPR